MHGLHWRPTQPRVPDQDQPSSVLPLLRWVATAEEQRSDVATSDAGAWQASYHGPRSHGEASLHDGMMLN